MCDKSYDYEGSLQFHKKNKHPETTTVPEYICEICDKKFSMERNLKRHVKNNICGNKS